MSRIVELIAALCPNGVEYRKLGDISRVLRGKRLTKKQLQENGRYPVFHGGLSPIGYFNENNRKADCVMVINVGASAGTVGYSDCDFWSSDGCYCLACSNFLNQKFLYVVLKSQEYFIQSRVRHAGIPTLDATVLEALEIPVPPIEVQREVVRILDTFTALTDELTAKLAEEVAARKAQYAYYRDRLLSRESLEALDGKPVEMVRLGDVSRVLRGKRLTKKQLQEDGKFPVFHGGLSPIGFFSEKNRDAKCVMVINVGASAGTVGYSDCDFWSSDGCYCLENSSRIDPRYLYAVLKSKEYEIRSKVRHAGIPTLDAKILECLEIPVPSLETQRKVVDILDRFDALTTSLTDGILAEIEARRSQYEYYRDRLLDFPHKGSVAV